MNAFDIIKKTLKLPLDNYLIKIIDHSDSELIGTEGKIRSDTRNTFVLETIDGIKIIPKNYGKYKIKTDEIIFIVTSKMIIGTFKQRRKRKFRNW